MGNDLLKTLRKAYKQPELEIVKKQINNNNNNNNKYTIWAAGDYFIYLKKETNIDGLSNFFKDYNYDVISEGNDTNIYIKSKNSKDHINTEYCITGDEYKEFLLDFEEDCKEDDPNNNENWLTELENMKKFDSYYMIKATNETESKFIVLLALYILKEKGDVLVYDTFNGVYLNPNRLQALQELIILQKKIITPPKSTKKNNIIENIIVITFFLSGIFMVIFAFAKMIIPTIISLSTVLICSLIIAIIGKIKEKKKQLLQKETDKIEIEIAIILNELYELIKKINTENLKKERKYLMLRIKDQSVSKNCTITDLKQFAQRVKERETTIGYELTTGWVIGNESDEEWEDISKVLVKIDNSDTINIDFQNEINQEIFDKILNKIESLIKNKYNKNVEINYITRDKSKPKIEYIDFGILGKYRYDMINYETTEEITEEQECIRTGKVLNDYYLHIDEINKKIFYKIYNALTESDYKIWEKTSFDIIIDRQKLPYNFDELNDEQKRDVLYINEYTDYNELWNKLTQLKPYWNLNRIKEDTKITNIVINDIFGTISIEFYGIFSFFTAYIELDYKNNYDVKVFDPS